MQTSIFSNVKVSYAAVLLLAAVLYIATCAPGVLWQDSGMYQYRIWHNDIEGKLGLALSHPLYHIIGIGVKSIPLGEYGYRINLISAIFAAISVANIFLLLRLWLGRNMPAVIAAITLALSHTMWQHASIAEIYTSYTALFTAELIFLLQYFRSRRIGYLCLLGLFNGLAIANHMWAVIALTCYLVLMIVLLAQKQIRLKHLGVIGGLWIVGAMPYGYLVISKYIETGDFTATLVSALFGNSWQGAVLNIRFLTNMRLLTTLVKENMIFMAYNFPTPNAIFFFAGLYALKKSSPSRGFRYIFLALLILFFIFAFRYTVPDRYAFFIPFYCLASILIGIGFNMLACGSNRRIPACIVFILALLPIPIYIIAPITAQNRGFKLTRREVPHREEYTWFLQPWKTGYDGAERFASEALGGVENAAIIIADGTTVYPLWNIQEIKGLRKDVEIISEHRNYRNRIPLPSVDTIGELMAERTIYVVSPEAGYCPDYLLERYDFIRAGPIYRVVNRQ